MHDYTAERIRTSQNALIVIIVDKKHVNYFYKIHWTVAYERTASVTTLHCDVNLYK